MPIQVEGNNLIATINSYRRSYPIRTSPFEGEIPLQVREFISQMVELLETTPSEHIEMGTQNLLRSGEMVHLMPVLYNLLIESSVGPKFSHMVSVLGPSIILPLLVPLISE